MHILSTPIEYLKGVGPAKAELLKKEVSIFTYGDLLQYYPFRYIDKSKVFNISDISDDMWLINTATTPKQNEEIIPIPAARPSTPSIKLKPLVITITTKQVNK